MKITQEYAHWNRMAMAEIMENIRDTVTIDTIIRPVYNFTAAGDS